MADDVNLTGGIFFLGAWSAMAVVWWLIAIMLIVKGPNRHFSKTSTALATLSVFKPISPVRDDGERKVLADAIESFIGQLDHDDEMLIGVDLCALPYWESIIDQWRAAWPKARIVVVARPDPDQLPNPKIAWMELLSGQAQGALWLWSDADVIAPPDFLRTLKEALMESEVNAVTAAYAVREVRKSAAMFDALFVNVEFLPGALLLGRLGATEFAYGAATIFRATTFFEHIKWNELGAQLADDHELGRRLKPVQLTGTIVSTFTLPGSWFDALGHYYRWQKTVRWCRPAGYAAMILVIPMVGWTAAIILLEASTLAFAGLVSQWLLEILFAAIMCSLLGCRLVPRTWGGLLLWPVVRMISWMAAWLPLPVVWGRKKAAWHSPSKSG